MAGMLPGVESARRRRFHKTDNLTNYYGSDQFPAATSSRRSSLCLYATSHDHHSNSSTVRNPIIRQESRIMCDESRLGAEAREAKKRLDERLQPQWRSQNKRSMDKSWIGLPRCDRRYAVGLWSFVEYVKANAHGNTIYYCPCMKCQCRSDMYHFTIDIICEHLKTNGFWDKYKCWIYHGETSSAGQHDHGQFPERASTSNDPTTMLINNMFPYESGVFAQVPAVELVNNSLEL